VFIEAWNCQRVEVCVIILLAHRLLNVPIVVPRGRICPVSKLLALRKPSFICESHGCTELPRVERALVEQVDHVFDKLLLRCHGFSQLFVATPEIGSLIGGARVNR
jgi:hypothetical protein